MILVTVGAQMPFDRLVRAVDTWAEQAGRDDVFAQVGPGGLRPRHGEWTEFMAPAEFRERLATALLVVAHAGMGTILTCLQYGKPLIVMPRLASRRETRNDHQVATARRFAAQERVNMAVTEEELTRLLDAQAQPAAREVIAPFASARLISALRVFIEPSEAASLGTESAIPGSAGLSHS